MRKFVYFLLASAALAGCKTKTGDQRTMSDTALHLTLEPKSGSHVSGTATFKQQRDKVVFTAEIHGLTPGVHAIHIHEKADCSAADGTSTGGHWNPTNMKHGSMNPQGPHEGDLPNMVVAANGRGTLATTLPGATMAGLLDADGGAIVVHAGPDDLMTDPAGKSGGRIACGVFQPA